jgi:hypothetical protein
MNFKLFFEHRIAKTSILQQRIDAQEHFSLMPSYKGLSGRGYLLQDGALMLFGDGADHRQISSIYFGDENSDKYSDVNISSEIKLDKYSNSRYMFDFMNTMGAIRYHTSKDGWVACSYLKNPTSRQIHSILATNFSSINIDKYDKSGHSMKSGVFSSGDEASLEKFLKRN